MIVLLVVGLGIAALVRLWVTRRREAAYVPERRSIGRTGWRKLTWAILAWNVLALVWLVAGLANTADNCAGEFGDALDACQAGAAVGTTIGVTFILLVWALGDVILGVVWLVTRRPQRSCPVCGTTVAVGLTTCPSCGHDFRAAVTGSA